MKLSLWCKDFVPEKQKQTNAQAWVRLHNLPFEYWHPRILLSIASILGSPVKIYQATLNREFFHYARIQIDIYLQFELQQRVLVERDGFRFEIPVTYEKLPEFCSHCYTIGHLVGECRVLKRAQDESNKPQQKETTKNKATVVSNAPKQNTYVPKQSPNQVVEDVNAVGDGAGTSTSNPEPLNMVNHDENVPSSFPCVDQAVNEALVEGEDSPIHADLPEVNDITETPINAVDSPVPSVKDSASNAPLQTN